MNMTGTNHFTKFQVLGYTRLVPIIPPDADISDRSSLSRALGKENDPRGKAVGIKGRDGKWFGYNWVPYEGDAQDMTRWQAMGAGVGIKTGQGLVLIDADTKNLEHAKIIRDQLALLIPDPSLIVRVGNYPKAGYVVRTDPDFRYSRIEFGDRDEKGRLLDRVEILSEGRQFVAHGIHPKTNKPYQWPKGVPHYDALPFISGDLLLAFLENLRHKLPSATTVSKEGSTPGETDVNQEALRGDLHTIRKAVRAIPNTSELFPTRESYRDFGYAIKAALPDNAQEAFDLFAEWCDRWENDHDEVNDPDVVASDWRRMKPPFRRGAGWLYELAERVSNGKFTQAEVWFEALPDSEIDLNPFKDLEEKSEKPIIKATPYSFKDPRAIPKREWLYGNHYIRKFVSATVAPSGVGKSSLEIVEALVMATGKPLLGVEPKGQFRVWLWNGEDPIDELERRIGAARLHYGITDEDIGDRLFIDSGRQQEIILATTTRNGTVIAEPTVAALISEIKLNRFDVIQIDPFVSSHRVVENDNGAIDLVSKKWANIADTCNCAVELVHHVRKLNGAEITIEDSRGAGSLIATSRSARALTKMQKGEAARLGLESVYRRLFRFGDGKNNLALPADERTEWMELASVPLGNGGGNGLDAVMHGDIIGVVARFKMPEAAASVSSDEKSAALELIKAGEWRKDVRAGDAWVGNPIAQAMQLDLSEETDKAHVKGIITAWIRDGVLKEVSRQDAKRMQKTFVEVADKDSLSNDIFS